jgi:predicted metalloprotease
MRWTSRGQNPDVEDRRGEVVGRRRMIGGPRLGIGGILLLLVLSVVFKRDLFQLVGMGSDVGEALPGQTSSTPYTASPEEDRLAEFASFVVGDVQDTWTREFEAAGERYERAKLVLFTDAVRSGCGFAEAAMGPFYCPADGKVYVDLGFYRELKERFGAPGDFAQAYVIAHEIGHHVQHLLGIDEKVRSLQASNPGLANELSVRLELQADCLAGVWGHSTARRDILEAGDVEEGLGAAAAVGDDRIQAQATGEVRPETWTHGSSKQRATWFRTGFESGDMSRCDTFAGLGGGR